MRKHLIKFLYSVVTLSGFSISKSSAENVKSDTTKLLATTSKKDVELESSIIPANIIFPENLENAKEQSLEYVEIYSDKKRNFLLSTFESGKKYFPKIISVLKQFQLPEELKVLIALESGFSGNAVSKAGAVGYWQMMDPVAEEYGLKISSGNHTASKSYKKDERKNFIKSTFAVAKYFRDQRISLNNNILLMVASYNCGMGNLRSAIKRCHKPNPCFWDLKDFLPKETRNYVMNFIALNVILNNYDNFANNKLLFAPKIITIPFQMPELNNSIPVEAIDIN